MLKFKYFREALVYKARSFKNPDEVGTEYRAVGTGSHLERKLSKVHSVRISDIVTHEGDDKTHKDTAHPDTERHVQGMIKSIKAKRGLEPVLLVKHKKGYKLIDGHHRLEAHKRTGHSHINAHILNHRHWKNEED